MKYSGVEWIGEIPDNWALERLQWHLEEIKESNNPLKTKQVLSLTNKLGVIPYEEKGEHGNKAKENVTEYKIAYPNTIVANSMNILIGSVGKCEYFGCVSPVYYVFKPKKGENIDFLNYVFQVTQFQKELRRFANGILEIRLRVSSNDILKRYIAFPPKEEQQKIVNFLNQKTQEIDSLIRIENQQIEKLKEYKQAVITEAVTKGLNKNIAMKDSGITWIEKIPNGRKAVPLKTLFNNGKGLPITKENLVDNGIKVISYGQIHAKYNNPVSIDDRLFRFVPDSWCNSNPECLVHKSDFIFADTSEDVAGAGDFIYIDREDKIFAGYHCVVLKAEKQENYKYLAYLFMSQPRKNQIQCRVNGVKLFSISRSILLSTSVIFPTEKEQDEIVKKLDLISNSIDETISIKQQKIEQLSEYKKSLIYEYVTGKKEVCQ